MISRHIPWLHQDWNVICSHHLSEASGWHLISHLQQKQKGQNPGPPAALFSVAASIGVSRSCCRVEFLRPRLFPRLAVTSSSRSETPRADLGGTTTVKQLEQQRTRPLAQSQVTGMTGVRSSPSKWRWQHTRSDLISNGLKTVFGTIGASCGGPGCITADFNTCSTGIQISPQHDQILIWKIFPKAT